MGAGDIGSVTVAQKAPGIFGGDPAGPTVVWMRGEHDVSNASRLSQVIAEIIAMDDEDLVIDLSEVAFMSGGTIAIFLRANAFLNSRSRALILRAPRVHALRLLGLCGLANLVQPGPGDSVQMTAASDALRSWVAVPVAPKGQEAGAASSDATETSDAAAGAEAAESPLVEVLHVDAE